MPEPLTSLERRILDYLVEYLRHNTYQPSIREIGRRFDIRSTKTVSEYLQALADKGWIERDPSRSRGVRLLDLDLGAETVTVPVYDRVTEPSPRKGRRERLAVDRRIAGGGGCFFVTMTGDSMDGAGIRDGDLLLVEPVSDDDIDNGDIVLARLEGEATVKRLDRSSGDVVLESANDHYAPTLVPDDGDFAVIGRVCAVLRRLRAPVTASASAAPVSADDVEGATP